MNKNGFVTIIAVVLAVLILIGVGFQYYRIYKSQTFRPTGVPQISSDEAITAVMNLPDVKKWQASIVAAGGTPAFSVIGDTTSTDNEASGTIELSPGVHTITENGMDSGH